MQEIAPVVFWPAMRRPVTGSVLVIDGLHVAEAEAIQSVKASVGRRQVDEPAGAKKGPPAGDAVGK